MTDGFWIAVLIVVGVVVYALAKILKNMRKSDIEWRAVDKSKLKVWDDDDDWD